MKIKQGLCYGCSMQYDYKSERPIGQKLSFSDDSGSFNVSRETMSYGDKERLAGFFRSWMGRWTQCMDRDGASCILDNDYIAR